jgi:hypothetical protein
MWTFDYGPNGHAVLAKSAFQRGTSDTATLHWEGGNLLFITDQATGLSVVTDGALSLGDFDTAGYTSSTDGCALNYNGFPSPERDPNTIAPPNPLIETFAYT